jgi:hypothetical protein
MPKFLPNLSRVTMLGVRRKSIGRPDVELANLGKHLQQLDLDIRLMKESLPLLNHALDAPTAFSPGALVEAVRADRHLATGPIPEVCS